MTKAEPGRHVTLALFTVYVLWGSTYLAIRYVVAGIPPFAAASLRFLVAGALMFAIARWQGAALPTRREFRDTAIVGVLLLGIGNTLVGLAEQTMPSGVAALFAGTSPVWMVLFETARTRERPDLMTISGVLLGFVGVFVLVGHDLGTSALGFSAIILMIASLTWSAGSVYARGASLPKHAGMSAALQMLVGGTVAAVMASVRGEWPATFGSTDHRAWSALAYLVVFGSLIGYTAYGYLLRWATAAVASTYAYVNPIVAVILGVLIAREALSVRTVIAASIILVGVLLVNLARFRNRRGRSGDLFEEVA